ncbi:MAG: hypothetical protein NTW08_05205 [Gammaproteobacteria bacterium]|nr:hypothetical protein [Gammaproteobacteria bacterium]
MKASRLSLLVIAAPLFLTACESMNGFMMDDREPYSRSEVVTQPAPRTTISSTHAVAHPQTASRIVSVPTAVQGTRNPAMATSVDNKQTTVVPNVAPALGE